MNNTPDKEDLNMKMKADLANSKPKSNLKVIIFLLAIIFIGGVLRFWGLSQKGLFHFDEGVHTKESLHIKAMMDFWLNSIRIKVEEKITGKQIMTKNQGTIEYQNALNTGAIMVFARPLYIFLSAIFNYIFSNPITAILMLSGFLGTLSILIIFIIARELKNNFFAILSSLFFAISGYHVIYSRMAFAEIPSVGFLLFSFFCILKVLSPAEKRDEIKWCFLAGLFAGFSFTANYRYILAVMFMLCGFICEILLKERRKSFSGLIKIFFYFICGFIIAPVMFEGYYHTEFLLSRKLKVPFTQPTYFEQFMGQSKLQQNLFGNIQSQHGIYERLPLEFPYLYCHLTGFLSFIFAILGMLILLKKRYPARFLLLFTALGPIIFYSIFSHREARYFVVCLPFFSILTAVSFISLDEYIRKHKSSDKILGRLLIFLLILLLSEEIFRTIPLVKLKSGYSTAIDYLKKNGDLKHISSQAHITVFYAGVENTAYPPATEEELKNLIEKNFRYYLVDAQALIGGFGGLLNEKLKIISEIQKKSKPILSIPNPSSAHFLFWFEHNNNFSQTMEFMKELNNTPWGKIEIFKIE